MSNIVSFNSSNCYVCANKDFQIFIYKPSSSFKLYALQICFDNASIYKEFRRLKDLRSFALDLLHIFGFSSLTVDVFLHPEEYME